LKGLLAWQGQTPLKSHDLVFLIDKIGIGIPEQHAEFLEMLNEVSVPARYPDELDSLVMQYPRKRTVEILERCREVYTWLKNCL
jgi:HEPN domain-containing protein